MTCELCKIIANKKEYKIYFETDEVIILEKNDNLIIAMPKTHKMEIEGNKASGLIKIAMKVIGRNKPNNNYCFKKVDDCDHFGIYITIK